MHCMPNKLGKGTQRSRHTRINEFCSTCAEEKPMHLCKESAQASPSVEKLRTITTRSGPGILKILHCRLTQR